MLTAAFLCCFPGLEKLTPIVLTLLELSFKRICFNICFWLISFEQTKLCFNQFFNFILFQQRFYLSDFNFRLTVDFLSGSVFIQRMNSLLKFYIICIDSFVVFFLEMLTHNAGKSPDMCRFYYLKYIMTYCINKSIFFNEIL